MRMKYRRFRHPATSTSNLSPQLIVSLGYEIDEKLGRICLKPTEGFCRFLQFAFSGFHDFVPIGFHTYNLYV